MRLKYLLFAALISAVAFQACEHEPVTDTTVEEGPEEPAPEEDDCDLDAVTFSSNVKTIISDNCEGCHNAGFAQGGVMLTNYDEIKTVAESGQLAGVLRADGYPQMPTSGPLEDCDIEQIEKWIENGNPND